MDRFTPVCMYNRTKVIWTFLILFTFNLPILTSSQFVNTPKWTFSATFDEDLNETPVLTKDISGIPATPLIVNPSIKTDMGLNPILMEGYNGTGINIGILDTGVNILDQRFDDDNNLFTTDDYRITAYYSAVPGTDPYDRFGHGTSVAGVIASRPVSYNDDIFSGIAVGSKIHSIKTLDDDGIGYNSYILNALNYVLSTRSDSDPTNDIDVINLSFGHLGNNIEIERKVKEVWTAGVIVVAAGGNEGYAVDGSGNYESNPVYFSVNTPGSTLEAISVAAMYDDQYLASFSSIGPTPNSFYCKPELAAPGTYISSLGLHGQESVSGTSIASPIIAGGIALLLEKCRVNGINPNPNEVKAALIDSCIDLGYNIYMQGAGLPNFSLAYDLLADASYARNTVHPKTLTFPNMFDYSKETKPFDQTYYTTPLSVNTSYPYLVSTLIIGKALNNTATIDVDPSIQPFITVYNVNTIKATGQYPIGIDFDQIGFFKPMGNYFGSIIFRDGDVIIAKIDITISTTFIGMIKGTLAWMWANIIMWSVPLFAVFGTVLGVNYKKAKTDTNWLSDCPEGSICDCDRDTGKCSIRPQK